MAKSVSPSSYPPGTTVALYLRRSTDTHQEESLETQRRGATEYCVAHGWVIVEEFVDDAVSRAEFVKRPGLIRMLNHASSKAFQLVVIRDESRLGGDMQRTGLAMQDIADAGVGIVYYISDELVSMEDAVDKFLVAARNFASELEREKISSRVHEHLVQKARTGKPAGGICFGYDIVDKRYVVCEPEAEAVRRMFAQRLAGQGFRAIAYKLNRDGVATPRRGAGWSPATVRFVLTNPRYIGEARYNQTRKLYKGGTKVMERRPAAEHVTYPTPAIVDRATWNAVQQSLVNNPKFGSAVTTKGAPPRYLLSGISRCAACGGPMTVKQRGGRWRSCQRAYVCGWNKDRGPAMCQSGLSESCDQVDGRVLERVRQLISTQDILADLIAEVRAQHAEQRATLPSECERLQAEIDTLQRESARLAAALATFDEPPEAVVDALKDRQARLRVARSKFDGATATVETIDQTLAGVELYARKKLRELVEQLGDPETAREALMVFTGGEKLRFEVVDGRFAVVGSVGFAGLLPADSDCEEPRTSLGTVRMASEAFRLPFAA